MVNSLIALVEADPSWAPFKALSDVDLGLLISARKLDLTKPISLTDSGKNSKKFNFDSSNMQYWSQWYTYSKVILV